jgi:hypothetical protein
MENSAIRRLKQQYQKIEAQQSVRRKELQDLYQSLPITFRTKIENFSEILNAFMNSEDFQGEIGRMSPYSKIPLEPPESFLNQLSYEEKRIYFTQFLPVAKEIEKLDDELIPIDMNLDKEYDAQEGEAHINWLRSEYGDDVFPDRD